MLGTRDSGLDTPTSLGEFPLAEQRRGINRKDLSDLLSLLLRFSFLRKQLLLQPLPEYRLEEGSLSLTDTEEGGRLIKGKTYLISYLSH